MAPFFPTAECARVDNDLGPSMDEYWPCCWEHQPDFFATVWITAPALGAIATFISLRQYASLRAAPVTGFRQIYLRCSLLPITTALGNLIIVMTSPRSVALGDVIKAQYEGFVLFGFANLIFQMLTLEVAAARENDGDDDEPEVGERIVKAIGVQGARKYFAVAPLCCCFGCLMRKHHLSGRQLLLCLFFLQQYILVIPGTSLISLWAALVAPEQFVKTNHWCNIFKKISELCALWGLFVLYVATKKMLTKWRTTQKFVSLKVIVLIQVLQRPIVALVLRHVVPLFLPDKGFCLPIESLINVTSSWLLMGWCVVLAVLISRAFTAKEIMSETGTYIPGNFELDLKRHVQSKQRTRSTIFSVLQSERTESSLLATLPDGGSEFDSNAPHLE